MKATGKDHARVNLAIWGDDDFLDLLVDEQALYFALWTSPGLSYCGAGDWHSGRLSNLAADWTRDRVEAAAGGLSRGLFLIVDVDTDEYLLRSWIKHDGLWRTPNMAVSVANARAELSSRTLRGVVVHEVRRIRDAHPDSSSWKRSAVASMLDQRAVDPAEVPPFNPSANPGPNPTANPWRQPIGLTPAATVNPNPSANPGPTPAPSPATTSNYKTTTKRARDEHDPARAARESSSTFSDGTPIPEEPPADPDERVIVAEIVPTEIGTAARPRPPRAEPAHKTTVRMVLGHAGYPQATIDQLARQVAKLAGKHDADLIAEALREWDRRPDVKPSYLGSVLGDVVKAKRARPEAGAATTKAQGWLDLVNNLPPDNPDDQKAIGQ